ncbi:hypothetical protein SAMN04487972_12817 [Paracoccus halophilus]|uniref:Uncharacterized protein n=1 Tax=Paracoccus halophilus TaxID=376733 RepID=A0A099EXS7_9RHOB|nr:hypothetical protein [Paracoccus halophilus]KGJ02742.1 hypothetical protein IT41_16580 [Paracoccus halophilus]SFA60378.1 hypothetical protein SAMN04487972_12817 [Paracoccus halophilus]
MSLPPCALYPLIEVSARWGGTIADIVEWDFAGHLEILVAIPPTRFGGALHSGLVAIAPSDVLRMCRRFGVAHDEILILRVRGSGAENWSVAHPPEEGLLIDLHDLTITADTLAKFEDRHRGCRRSNAGPTMKYDWEHAYLTMIIRIHERGLPASLTELVAEMQEWFIQTSADGDAPDESTIRKRISPIWHQLRAPVPA